MSQLLSCPKIRKMSQLLSFSAAQCLSFSAAQKLEKFPWYIPAAGGLEESGVAVTTNHPPESYLEIE
jgi:hypothetical protein